MRRTLVLVSLVCFALTALGQTKKVEAGKVESQATKLHGYVVDQMCAKGMMKKSNPMERAAKHTKECALEEACAASGFGLVYGDANWVKFDEKGDQLAKLMIEKSKKDKDLMADVTGMMKEGKFIVATLTESMMSSEEMKNKSMKKEDAHHGHDHK
jgi:hypothetical protein